MSHAAPPPPPQGPDGPTGPGSPPEDVVGFGAQPPSGPGDSVWTIHAEEPPQPKRNKTPIVVGIVAATALVVGGGGFALVQANPFNLFGSGDQPAEALPANSIAYAAVDLDPSAAQKVDAIRFLNTFPQFKDLADLDAERDDIRKELLADALDGADCPGVSYAKTIEPWLGNKIGIAAVPSDGGEPDPDPVIAVEVTDEDAAADGLAELNDCGAAGEQIGFVINDGYALLAETKAIAEGAADDAASGTLADDDEFKADMDALGEQGIATGWMDVGGFLEEFAADAALDPAQADVLADTGQRMAATVRFDSDAVELATVAGFDGIDLPEADAGSNEIVDLPESTAFALSVSGGSEYLAAGWDQMLDAEQRRCAGEVAGSTSRTRPGSSVPDDLETLLGDNLLFAVGSEGLSVGAVQSGDLGSVDAGLRFTGDPAALQDLYGRAVSTLEETFGIQMPVTPVEFDDGLVLATNDDYARS